MGWGMVGSRIADPDRNWQAAQDVDVSGWDQNKNFIIAMAIYCDSHGGGTSSLLVNWRNVTMGGTWDSLRPFGQLREAYDTVLVDGDDVTAAEKGCNALGGFEQEPTEIEGDTIAPSITLSQDGWCEVQCAVDPLESMWGCEYEFAMNVLTAGKRYTASAKITMAGRQPRHPVVNFQIPGIV